MDYTYPVLKFVHIIGFVFMSIPLFNLIVVNERALMGAKFNYGADRYMENIISHGAIRCYVFQLTVFASGIGLLIFGHWHIEALWINYFLLAKTIILVVLTGLLSVVHFYVQPKIEECLKNITPETQVPDNFLSTIKPFRVLRKRLATGCLFLVLTTIILGMQVYQPYPLFLNCTLIGIAALFSLRVNKTLVRFGWL